MRQTAQWRVDKAPAGYPMIPFVQSQNYAGTILNSVIPSGSGPEITLQVNRGGQVINPTVKWEHSVAVGPSSKFAASDTLLGVGYLNQRLQDGDELILSVLRYPFQWESWSDSRNSFQLAATLTVMGLSTWQSYADGAKSVATQVTDPDPPITRGGGVTNTLPETVRVDPEGAPDRTRRGLTERFRRRIRGSLSQTDLTLR